jgi:hypothetical protein
MRDLREQATGLSRAEAKVRWEQLAAEFKALGLTRAPHRMCVGIRKAGKGYAVVTGYQDSD